MPYDLLNILSNSNKDIDNQKLMDYLSGKLSAQDKHEVEKWMIDSQFFDEAVEGLKDVSKQKDLQVYVDQLNKELHKYIQQKKHRRERKKIKDSTWIYFAVLIILLLLIVSYLVIRKAAS